MPENGAKRPLNHFPPGTVVRLVNTEGCCRARGRLCAMGLTPGTQCEVLSAGRCGPCRLKVRETAVVIGCGMAEKIMAEQVAGAETHEQPADKERTVG